MSAASVSATVAFAPAAGRMQIPYARAAGSAAVSKVQSGISVRCHPGGMRKRTVPARDGGDSSCANAVGASASDTATAHVIRRIESSFRAACYRSDHARSLDGGRDAVTDRPRRRTTGSRESVARRAGDPRARNPHVAGSSLFSLLDDVASFLDDVAAMTKVAAKKTAGVLGDDLALNAEQVSGVSANRELPVVWAVAKGSLLNKAILVPLALAISAFVPALVTPLLMLGGAYLCYEGVEKVAHRLLHGKAGVEADRAALAHAAVDPAVDLVAFERTKIRGAVRTDFVLSAEIVVITLGTVAGASFQKQVAVLCGIALAMTVGVYGLVAGIVKLDDVGLHLVRRTGGGGGSAFARGLGRCLLAFAPRFMRVIAFVGVVAMFLVGGGILAHGIPGGHDRIRAWTAPLSDVARVGPALEFLASHLIEIGLGVLVGAVALALVAGVRRLLRRRERAAPG